MAETLRARAKVRISTVKKYEAALRSLLAFSHDNLTFAEITPAFLQNYQNWFIDKGGSLTTVGINCRHLRAVYRLAIRNRVVNPEAYPFGVRGYVIPTGGQQVKAFLSVADKDRFVNYKPKSEAVAFGYDFAVFSYYANGINFADIASLKWVDVRPDHLAIRRQKTAGRSDKVILIYMHDRMREVISRRGKPGAGYVFPVLRDDMTDSQRFYAIGRFVRRANKALKQIEQELALPVRLRTYTLRHTFSRVMRFNGASAYDVKEALGHESLKTTENYLNTLEIEGKKRISEGL